MNGDSIEFTFIATLPIALC